MPANGWISVYDSRRPESGEEVLTLSYTGDFPAPEDMFSSPDNRSYCVCTFFYVGDQDWNEVPGDPSKGTSLFLEDIVFDEEGFYCMDLIGPNNTSQWRRLSEIREGNKLGIVCWKHLDYPTAN